MNTAFTTELYAGLQSAYDVFNRELFGDRLPNVIITLQRRSRASGYYHMDSFKRTTDELTVDEIALNPDHFNVHGHDYRRVLSTLVHEMCHLWQRRLGETTPKVGYHNREWGDKMDEVGLIPSSTGEEGGKRTGTRMSHVIVDGGQFDKVFKARICGDLTWLSNYAAGVKTKRPNSRVKYTCPTCGLNVWGGRGLSIKCIECDVELELAEG